MLEGGEFDAVGVELVERLRVLGIGVGWSGQCGNGGFGEEGEEMRLAREREGKRVGGIDELQEVDGFVDCFSSEGVIGDGGEHGLGGGEGRGLVFQVKLGVDEVGVGGRELGFGSVGGYVAGCGFYDRRLILAEGAELGQIDQVSAGKGFGIAGGTFFRGGDHGDGEGSHFGVRPVGDGLPCEFERTHRALVGSFWGELRRRGCCCLGEYDGGRKEDCQDC